MGCISPGETELMTNAIGRLGLAEGSRVLEVGCGEGDTLAHIAAVYGFDCHGIDKSDELIRRGREKHTGINLWVADAPHIPTIGSNNKTESQSFDAVILECVLSVSDDPEKMLYECAAALTPGGYLLIADLCNREDVRGYHAGGEMRLYCTAGGRRDCPIFQRDIDRSATAADTSGFELISTADTSGFELISDADTSGLELISAADTSGLELISAANTSGLELVSFENRTADLDSFAAEKIMAYGSLEKYYEATIPDGSDFCDFFPSPGANSQNSAQGQAPGYFLALFSKHRIRSAAQ